MTLYDLNKRNYRPLRAKTLANKSNPLFNNMDLFTMLLAILSLLILPFLLYYSSQDSELMDLLNQMEVFAWR